MITRNGGPLLAEQIGNIPKEKKVIFLTSGIILLFMFRMMMPLPIVSGQVKDFQQKQNGNLHQEVGVKVSATVGEMILQYKENLWLILFRDHFLMVIRVMMA